MKSSAFFPRGVLAILVIASTALLLIGFVTAFNSLAASACENTTITEVISPDARLKVVIFERDCGATTAPSTQVSVIAASKTLSNEIGNVFISNSNRREPQTNPNHNSTVRAIWRSKDELSLTYHAALRVFKAENQIGSVKVIYEKIAE